MHASGPFALGGRSVGPRILVDLLVSYRDFRDMRWLIRGIDGLSRFFGGIAAVLVIILVVLMLYDVVLHYALNAPTTWGNDMNTWLMGASFVLSIAYGMSTDSHVRVDLLYD